MLPSLRRASALAILILSFAAGKSIAADPVGGVVPDGSRTPASASQVLAPPPVGLANVDYGGGPVMHSNRTHVIFWNPSNQAFAWDPGYQSVIDAFLTNVAAASHSATSVYGLTGQYRDAGGPAAYDSTFAGGLQDSDPAPASGCTLPPTAPAWPVCLTSAQLRAEVLGFVQAHGLPTGLGDIYFLLTPNGLGSCKSATGPANACSLGGASGSYCGYHTRSSPTAGVYVLWANIPYQAVVGHCHNTLPRPNASTADTAIDTIAHEHIEAITDPLVNAWLNPPDTEVADLCVGHYGKSLGGTSSQTVYNQVIAGGHYFLEEEWSNDDAQGSTDPALGCTASDEVDPVSFNVPSLTQPAKAIAFRGAATDPDGQIVAYDWDFGDGSVHRTGSSQSHAYAHDATYSATLTTLDASGQLARSVHQVRVDELPAAKLALGTKHPRAKQQVSFNGRHSHDPDGGIRTYRWQFGDGSGKTGAKVKHTYKRAGRYTVTLTVADRSGLLAAVKRQIHVAPAR